MQPTVTDVIEFLTELFHSGIGYSCLNTARSALSTVIVFPDNTAAGSHPLVVRFMKVLDAISFKSGMSSRLVIEKTIAMVEIVDW